jgi:hypothetical protein
MRYKNAVLCVVALCGFIYAAADRDSSDGETAPSFSGDSLYTHYIGVAAGVITGYGFSYRYYFNERQAVQITGFPFYREEYYDDSTEIDWEETRIDGYLKSGTFSLGCVYVHTMVREFDLRFVAYTGANILARYVNKEYRSFYYGDSTPNQVSEHCWKNRIHIGGGFGGEAQMWRISASCMVGAVAFMETHTQKKGIWPSGEVALYFGF